MYRNHSQPLRRYRDIRKQQLSSSTIRIQAFHTDNSCILRQKRAESCVDNTTLTLDFRMFLQ
jgi:hypothetical protein